MDAPQAIRAVRPAQAGRENAEWLGMLPKWDREPGDSPIEPPVEAGTLAGGPLAEGVAGVERQERAEPGDPAQRILRCGLMGPAHLESGHHLPGAIRMPAFPGTRRR